MKPYGIFVFIFAAALTVVLAVILLLPQNNRLPKADGLTQAIQMNTPPQPLSNGDKSKSRGRDEYEWYRLRDPATGQIPRGIRSRELAFAKKLPVRGRALDEQEWIFRGPFNVGGRTRALAVDVADSNRILAGGVTGGMWFSEDGANTWSRTTDLAVTPSVTCLVQDPRDGHTHIWYHGTGEYRGSGSRSINSRVPQFTGDGIFKSIDNGLSWQQLASTVSPVHEFASPFDVVFRIAVNPANTEENEVYAATYGTIQRSLDGGESWHDVLGTFESTDYAWTDVMVTPSGVIYATLDSDILGGGFWRSEDNGETWDDILPANFPGTFHRTVMTYVPTNENVLYFLSVTPGAGYIGQGGGHSLWRLTRDGGVDTWENLSANMPNFENESPGFGYDYHSQGGYNMVVAVHPENPDVVYIGGTSMFYSRDAFNTTDSTYWIGGYNYYYGLLPGPNGMDICYPNHHADIHHMFFDPTNPDIMYCSHDGGLSKTTNSLAIPTQSIPFPWDYINGYITTQFYWVAVDPLTEGNLRIMGGMQDNGTFMGNSESELEPWVYMWGGDGMACDIGAAEQDNWRSFYVSTQYGGSFFRIVLDENDEFQNDYYYGIWGGDFERWITPFELTPYDYRGMFMTDVNSVWGNPDVPENGSGGWEQITINQNRWATALGVSNTETPVVYYGDFHPTEPDISRVYRIDEPFGATSIMDVSDLGFPEQGWIHCITVDPTDENKVIVVFTNYNVLSLFYSEDGGINWSNVGGNLEENPDGSGDGPSCYWAEIIYAGEQPVYLVGTTVGLFSTMELSGDSTVWELEGADVIGYNWVTTMDVRHLDGYVGIGTHGGGTFSTYLEVSGVEPDNEELQPTDYELTSIYPNPFNATANIMFKLPQRANLTVDVYNTLGQKVATLANSIYEPGRHRLVFNAGNLSSGVYFVRMKAGSYDATKKIVLMK